MRDLLIPDPAHAAAGAATLLVAALLIGLGALVGARRPALALVAGWGVADLVLLAGGTLFGAGLTPMLAALAICGAAGWFMAARFAPESWGPSGRVLLLMLPLLAIAAAITPAGFDEYSHWLPNLGYLVLHDHFPTLAAPNTVSVRPGYPPGSAFIGLAASRIVGRMAEGAGIVWDMLLAASLAALCAEAIEQRWRAGWGAAAVAVAATTLLSPSFQPGLMLSNYGDPPSGYVTGMLAVGLIAWPARGRALWTLGFCSAALVCVRQDSLTVFALVWLAALSARVRPLHLLALLPAPLLAATLWRVYQRREIAGGAADMLPLAQWHWAQLPETLAAMSQVMLRHWAHFGLILLLAALAAVAIVRPRRFTGEQRMSATIGAVIGAGKIASLAVLYLGADFTTAQAATATEFWRFSLHAAPAVTAAALLMLPFERLPISRAWAAAAFLAAALPVLDARHLRVDLPRHAPAPALRLRAIARDVAALTGGAPITLVDTTDADYMNVPHTVEFRYELLLGLRADLSVPVPIVRLIEGDPPREIVLNGGLLRFAGTGVPTDALEVPFIWFYDGGVAVGRLAGLDLPPGASYLVARQAGGSRVIRSWPLPRSY